MIHDKLCARCILPEGYPGVTFDDEGVCSLCQEYTPKKLLGEKALWSAIAERPGTKYDVLVPVSGGRDSTYVLYQAVKKFGKRVFALHFDNAFEDKQAENNFLEAVKRLGVDYTISTSRHAFPEKIVEQAVKSALPFGLFDLTTNCCVACTYGFRSASYREAIARGIPSVLWGDSDEEAVSFFYRSNRAKYFFSPRFYNYILFLFYTILFQLEFWIPHSKFFHFSAPTPYPGKEIQDFHFFDYVTWDRREIKRTIMEELGWSVPEGTVSTWRFGCKIYALANYCFKQTYGVSKSFDGFANMIRSGKMDREEALQHEEQLGLMDEELENILRNDMHLSEKDLSRYFGITRKT